MKILALSGYNIPILQRALQCLAKDYNYSNVFNPSLAFVGNQWHITFRAETFDNEKPFRAFYTYIIDSECAPPLDISNLLREANLPQVADPKLVKLGNELFLTFNTGNLGKLRNAIYLMKVWPAIGAPQKCEIVDRQTVEKNWAFFLDRDGLGAVYSLSPLVRLRLTDGVLGTNDILHFEKVNNKAKGKEISQSISIGSQLSFLTHSLAYMVVHDKPRIGGKRGYIGRLARLDLMTDGNISVTLSKIRLIHSARKLVYFGKRHNPNLLWAVYFSGLTARNDELVFGYGVNDIDFGFASVRINKLWP